MSETTPETPWTKRALELAATEGYYADYAAWQEWFDARLDGELGGAVDTVHASKMYAAYCSLFDAGVAAGRDFETNERPDR
jgi:hypothetical protein